MSYTNQIKIIHLSDLHFGSKHVCNPDDPKASKNGIVPLAKLIKGDLSKQTWMPQTSDEVDAKDDLPIFIIASGDFTQTASFEEFEEARGFLDELISEPILGERISKDRIFMVPGNHDVDFGAPTYAQRFVQYCNFHNTFYEGVRKNINAKDATNFTQIHVRRIPKSADSSDFFKILIVEINCSMYVQKDTVDQSRGQVDEETITKISTGLEELSHLNDFNDFIKIAVIHHHVVLLPSFIEAGRGVDSVVGARLLMEELGKNNFHAILHGHKHYPQVFTYDPEAVWNEPRKRIPQLIISGGTCGSTELPTQALKAFNTYSVITIKWHPKASQARIKLITQGLFFKNEQGILPRHKWSWETLNVTDKRLMPFQNIPEQGQVAELKKTTKEDDIDRTSVYSDTRGCLPVAEVMPSLVPEQAYEVRLWIEFHKHDNTKSPKLLEVEWSAGPLFEMQRCVGSENPRFCTTYHYWGPMLVQAKLTFENGKKCNTYIYARMP